MTSLPISNPSPAPRETVYSYLSRLAATWRTEVAELAYDMGAPFKRFLDQDPEAFQTLGDWAGLDLQQMEELLSWTGVRAGNVRMEFRGELFVSRALRNPVMRGCPVCLREDAARHDGPGVATMVMRGDWQMREANVCLRHRHPLVSLWKCEKPRDRFDIDARLREIEGHIVSGALDHPEVAASPYDLWLDDRLQKGSDTTWFEGQPLFAATTFCRLLGQAISGTGQTEDTRVRNTIHSIGFDVARHGEATIREALDRMASAATGALDEPNKAFGAMYTGLNRDYLAEAGFAPYRRILRECILDNWPIPPGETLLGEVVPKRRMHSVVTAARATGVGAQVIEHFLSEIGYLAGQDHRPSSRRVFDARAHADLLAEIPTLVGPIAMRNAMGATRGELVALGEEGILIPRTRVAQVKNLWRTSDGEALVAELLTSAVPIQKDDDGWETLLLARKRRKVGISLLIEAIRAGRLPVGHRAGVLGFHGIVVSKSGVDALTAGNCGSRRQTPAGPGEIDVAGLMSAAAFGRSVGLRDHGDFIALIEAGQTPARKCMNPRTGRSQYRLSAEDIARFHRRFVTLPTLSEETGHHRNTVKSLLAASRVTRFTADGQEFGPVYLRSEAAKALE